VPDAPPVAGPDRALDAPPPDPLPPAEPLADAGCAGVDERDMATPTESPITAHIAAVATAIPRRLLVASNRPTLGRRACLAVGAETGKGGGEAGGGGGVAPVPPELRAAERSEVALDTGRPVRVSWGFVGPKSLMTALLLIVGHTESYAAFLGGPLGPTGMMLGSRIAGAAGSIWRPPMPKKMGVSPAPDRDGYGIRLSAGDGDQTRVARTPGGRLPMPPAGGMRARPAEPTPNRGRS
jgi:hypothetical protein